MVKISFSLTPEALAKCLLPFAEAAVDSRRYMAGLRVSECDGAFVVEAVLDPALESTAHALFNPFYQPESNAEIVEALQRRSNAVMDRIDREAAERRAHGLGPSPDVPRGT